MQDFGYSGMRNAVFPSFSSPFCSLGNNEGPPNANLLSSMEFERLPHDGPFYPSNLQPSQQEMKTHKNSYSSSGFFLESPVSNGLQLGSFNPLSAIEIPQAINYQSVSDQALVANSTYENTPLAKMPCRLSLHDEAIENARKRTVAEELINREAAVKESKKRKAIYTEEMHRQPSDESLSTHQLKAPVRKSNKIGDRVTALQQLVSPFGKTDTASVLQEATIHIKLLQDQIQVLSTPYFRIRPPHHPQMEGEEKPDLRSRGLCLVPVSSTLNLAKEDSIIDRSTGRAVFPRF